MNVDLPKKLEETRLKLMERDAAIETLESRLVEKNEQLTAAFGTIEDYRIEQERISSETSHYGGIYASITEQLKAIRSERDELQKQTESLKGQLTLSNDFSKQKDLRLVKEMQLTDELRKRSGFQALQEEKAHALRQRDQAVSDSNEWSERYEARIEELTTRAAKLEDVVKQRNTELQSAEDAEALAREEAEEERQATDSAHVEMKALQEKCQELEDTLKKVQAAATKRKELGAETNVRPAFSSVTGPRAESYGFGSTPGNAQPAVLHQNGPGTPPIAPPDIQEIVITPGGTATQSAFRSIHGIHQPDGSFGRYRNRKSVTRPMDGDSMHSSSSKGSKEMDQGE